MDSTIHKSSTNQNGQELESRMTVLEAQMVEVRSRNQRVETNKAWETSRVRLASVTLVTYVTMTLVFSMLGAGRPFLDALVPTTGFFLSTLSLPFVRRAWERSQQRDRETLERGSGPRP